MKFYRRIVTNINIFFAGITGVLLVSGAGSLELKIIGGLIFLICVLNLLIYLKEFGKWCKGSVQAAASEIATRSGPAKAPAPPQGGGKPGGGGGGGGAGGAPPPQQQGGGGQR